MLLYMMTKEKGLSDVNPQQLMKRLDEMDSISDAAKNVKCPQCKSQMIVEEADLSKDNAVTLSCTKCSSKIVATRVKARRGRGGWTLTYSTGQKLSEEIGDRFARFREDLKTKEEPTS